MNTRLRLTILAAVFAFLTPATSILHAQVLAATEGIDVPDGTRKCIKPKERAPKPIDLLFTPLTCLEPVVNVSATTGNQAESFMNVNPTNTNNLVATSNNPGYNQHLPRVLNRCRRDLDARHDRHGCGVLRRTGGLGHVRQPVPGLHQQQRQPNQRDFEHRRRRHIQCTRNRRHRQRRPTVDRCGQRQRVGRLEPERKYGRAWGASDGSRSWGPFNAQQAIPSATGSFGGIAVGPGPNGGKVIVTYQSPTGGQGPATIYANVDADGLGAGGFGARITVSATNVGGFDFIPAQSGRSIDAEAGLVWDATGGPFNNRIYLVYTDETVNENNDTDILMRTSTDDGATWSAPVRVNDDATTNSQFLPYVALDPTTGTVAVGFHDCRNDNGVPGPGGTNMIPNDDAEYYGTFSTDGGATWAPNRRLSGGFSNAAAAANGIDFGDYVGLDARAGKLYAMWADNANCDGTNPNGTLHQFDLYANPLMLTGGTPSPTPTASPTPTPTPTASPTPTATATATPCVGDYTITQIGGSIVPGTTDIGNHGDDTVTTIALPFSYSLYGTTFTSINLSSNGNAQFMTNDTAFTNLCLPWTTHNYTIFPYWDDLYLVNSGFGIFTSVSGTAPNRIFNIEWRAQYFPGSGSANFELRLYEGQSRFDVIYGT